jgi:hypothetical protein
MVLADYNAYAGRDAPLSFDAGQLIEYRHPGTGEYVRFQPTTLQWTNDLNQLSSVADPQAVGAQVNGDRLLWPGAYGSGLDFEWLADTVRLIKYLHVASALPAPPAFIIAGGHPVLQLTLLFEHSAGVQAYVDGALWDEKANNPKTTQANVEFRAGANTLWSFNRPVAWHSNPDASDFAVLPNMRLRASGNSLFVDILVPYAWMGTATYPLKIDAVIDSQVGASSDDAWQDSNGSASITSTPMNMGTGSSSGSPLAATGFRFLSIGLVGIDTVDNGTYIECRKVNTAFNTIEGSWHAEDIDDAPTFSASENILARALTTASQVCAENINRVGGTWYQLPSSGGEWKSLIQEVIDRGGWASGQDIVLIFAGDGADNFTRENFASYDTASADAAKLHIVYTAGSSPVSVTPAPASASIGTVTPTVVGGEAKAPLGWFVYSLLPKGWFDPTAYVQGWWDDELTPPAAGLTVSPAAASAVAAVVVPTVILGSTSIAPTAASAVSITIGPTVVNVVVLTPAPASAVILTLDPTVILGAISVAPSPATVRAETVNPTVVLGFLVLAPSPAVAITTTVDPAVVLGSLTIAPSPASAVILTVDPSVVSGGGTTVAPTPAFAVAAGVAPTVVLGSTTVTPAAAFAVPTVVNPSVVLGSLSLTPVPAFAVATIVNPTVVNVVLLTPVPAFAVAARVNPAVVLGSLTLTPVPAFAMPTVVNPSVVQGSLALGPAPATAVILAIGPFVIAAIPFGSEVTLAGSFMVGSALRGSHIPAGTMAGQRSVEVSVGGSVDLGVEIEGEQAETTIDLEGSA